MQQGRQPRVTLVLEINCFLICTSPSSTTTQLCTITVVNQPFNILPLVSVWNWLPCHKLFLQSTMFRILSVLCDFYQLLDLIWLNLPFNSWQTISYKYFNIKNVISPPISVALSFLPLWRFSRRSAVVWNVKQTELCHLWDRLHRRRGAASSGRSEVENKPLSELRFSPQSCCSWHFRQSSQRLLTELLRAMTGWSTDSCCHPALNLISEK